MQYNMTVRKKDGNYQIIVSYKDGIKWRQKSKQGFATQREAKLYGQKIIDELKKTVTNPLDDSLKDITLIQFFEIFINERINSTKNTLITYKNALNVVDALKDKKTLNNYNARYTTSIQQIYICNCNNKPCL